jgi:hypothetical protein
MIVAPARSFARLVFVVSTGALAMAMLAQAFIAGVAATVDPEWWRYHLDWVHIFQWLVLAPPVAAWVAGYSRRRVLAGAIPFVLVGLQYVFADRAREGSWPLGFGLHAANAMLLFAVTIFLAWSGLSHRQG